MTLRRRLSPSTRPERDPHGALGQGFKAPRQVTAAPESSSSSCCSLEEGGEGSKGKSGLLGSATEGASLGLAWCRRGPGWAPAAPAEPPAGPALGPPRLEFVARASVERRPQETSAGPPPPPRPLQGGAATEPSPDLPGARRETRRRSQQPRLLAPSPQPAGSGNEPTSPPTGMSLGSHAAAPARQSPATRICACARRTFAAVPPSRGWSQSRDTNCPSSLGF